MTRHYHETHSPIPYSPARLRNIRGATRSRPVFPAQEFELLPGMFIRFQPFKVVPGREQITAETAMVVAGALTLRAFRDRAPQVLVDHNSGLVAEFEAPERLIVRNVAGALQSGVVRVVSWGS